MSKKSRSVLMWIMGMVLCPLGVAICANAGFGVSMIEAPVFVTYLKLSSYFDFVTFGSMEYALQLIVIILLCVFTRKFKWKYFLSFVTAVIFGFILDGWRLIIGADVYSDMTVRIICCIAGAVITSFAVACFFRTKLPLEAWELFVVEFADHFKIDNNKVKYVYDITSLGVGVLLMFIFFGKFDLSAIGIATIAMTIINAPLIKYLGKLIDIVIKEKDTEW